MEAYYLFHLDICTFSQEQTYRKYSPRAKAPPLHVNLDYSARPGAASLPIEGLGSALFKSDLLSI